MNRFTAIPAGVQFRPEQNAVKPKFYGTLNATVDAAGSGEYAEIDDQGRYKVIVPFDRSGIRGGRASRWVRMAQPYAGSGYGMHFPLHSGTEVLLTFVDGDPDRPIISGSVPNPETASPVSTSNQTQSMIRTGGGNQFRLEDIAGSQQIHFSSPTEESIISLGAPNKGNLFMKTNGTSVMNVGNNSTRTISGEEQTTVEKNNTYKINGKDDLTVKGDRTKLVESNENTTIKGNRIKDITGNENATVKGNRTKEVTGNEVITVKSDRTRTVDGKEEINVTGDVTQLLKSNKKTTVTGAIEQQSESSHIHITAATELNLKVGASELKMKQDGTIVLRGIKLEVTGQDLVEISGKDVNSVAENSNTNTGGKVLVQANDTASILGGLGKLNS
jgi:type VI secretion system secreted protein VgrG